MKKFEIIFGVVFLIALILKIIHLPGGSILATISLTLLANFYYFFSFAIFNRIKVKNIFSKSSYKGISTLRIIGSICVGFGLSTGCIGVLFKMMHYPGEKIISLTGLITISVIAIVALVKYFLSKSDFYKSILLRVIVIGGLGLFFFATNLGFAIN